MAMKLVDKTMFLSNINQFEMQRCVARKILDRMLRLATPNMGTHPRVQIVASTLIKHWAQTCGTDERLAEFADVARFRFPVIKKVQCVNPKVVLSLRR